MAQIRDEGYPLEVRVTWEFGDAARYAAEAMADGIEVVIAGGGDGTVNEVVNGIISTNPSPEIGVAVIPYGTANDFATSCGIPVGDPLAALQLAAEARRRRSMLGRSTIVSLSTLPVVGSEPKSLRAPLHK